MPPSGRGGAPPAPRSSSRAPRESDPPHQYDLAPPPAKTRLFLQGRGPYPRAPMAKRAEDRDRAGKGQSLQRLLEGPELARVAPHLAPEVLHRLIPHAGLEQCVDVVEALSHTQLTAVLDLDLW